MTAYGNILVIRLSSLGDVLLAMPAVRAIKDAQPATSVSWLVEGSASELLSRQGFIDRVIEFPRSKITGDLKAVRPGAALAAMAAFCSELRRQAYDLVIDFHGIVKSALFARLARAGRRVGFDRGLAREGSWLAYDERISGMEPRMHKAARNIRLAACAGAREPSAFGLAADAAAEDYIDSYFSRRRIRRPIFAVNPFCSKGSEFKRWELSRYAELIGKMHRATGATVMVLWGPGEEDEARRLATMAGSRTLLACPTTVPQLLALLGRTDLYVGGDTGVMHLAAFAHVPVVAIFGPTDHLVNGPYGNGHTVVRKELPCSPCRDKSCARLECLRSITSDEVASAALGAWAAAGGR